jgi:subtilase family serine protease
MADIEQAAGGRLGFLNPTLYSLASSDPSVYHEITSGCSLLQPNPYNPATTTGYCAHAGWNFVTGLGSIDAARLALHFAPSAQIVPVPEFPNGEPVVFALPLVMAVAVLVSRNQNPRFSS